MTLMRESRAKKEGRSLTPAAVESGQESDGEPVKQFDKESLAFQYVMTNLFEKQISRAKNDETVYQTLTQFRKAFVWNQTVNTLLHQNLEGIMAVFDHFADKSVR
jgi:hypothetical protein